MADLFKKMEKIAEELRPNIKDLPKEESKPEVKEEPKVEPEPEPAAVEEGLSTEELSSLDSDERAAFGEKENAQQAALETWNEENTPKRKSSSFINNQVADIENDYNKSKIILQGAINKNERFGGGIPWSTNQAKIETETEKEILRAGKEAMLGAMILFPEGKKSDFFALLWEDYNAEVNFTRANQGFAAKLERTQISQSFTDKNVKTSRNTMGAKDNILQSMQPAYG